MPDDQAVEQVLLALANLAHDPRPAVRPLHRPGRQPRPDKLKALDPLPPRPARPREQHAGDRLRGEADPAGLPRGRHYPRGRLGPDRRNTRSSCTGSARTTPGGSSRRGWSGSTNRSWSSTPSAATSRKTRSSRWARRGSTADSAMPRFPGPRHPHLGPRRLGGRAGQALRAWEASEWFETWPDTGKVEATRITRPGGARKRPSTRWSPARSRSRSPAPTATGEPATRRREPGRPGAGLAGAVSGRGLPYTFRDVERMKKKSGRMPPYDLLVREHREHDARRLPRACCS